MTQEEKDLLFKDICARLPYGVKALNMAEGVNEVGELDSIMTSRKYKDNIFVSLTLPNDSVMMRIEMVKPYLRSLSSMTEKEQKEFVQFHCVNICPIVVTDMLTFDNESNMFNYLNAHHFDYRGLIKKGLALEAPEGMYVL